MSLRTPTVVDRNGVDLAGTAADVAGDTWANSGQEFVVIKNGSGAGITVTLNIRPTAIDGTLGTVTDPTVAIAAGATRIIGPFPPGLYNDAQGLAQVLYSAVTTVTMTVIKANF